MKEAVDSDKDVSYTVATCFIREYQSLSVVEG
jgi:hypothetical protein